MDGFQEAAQPHGCPGQQEDREAQEPLWTQEIPDCTACHQRHTGSHHPLAPLLINELWPTSRSSTLLPGTAASSLWSDTNRNVTYMKSLATTPPSRKPSPPCLSLLPSYPGSQNSNSYMATIRMWILVLELLSVHRKGEWKR